MLERLDAAVHTNATLLLPQAVAEAGLSTIALRQGDVLGDDGVDLLVITAVPRDLVFDALHFLRAVLELPRQLDMDFRG